MSWQVVVLAILMFSCRFTETAHAAPRGDNFAVIDAGTPVAYAFNEAGVSGRNGIAGAVTLYGTGIDGTQFKLFETTVGYAESLTVTYYAWPELVSVSFEGTDGEGAGLSASVRLRKAGSGVKAEAGTWNDHDAGMLEVLEFPFRLQAFGTPPGAISAAELAGDGPKQAARIAVTRLFATGRSFASIIVLALWTIAVFVAAALWHRKQTGTAQEQAGNGFRRKALALSALVCIVGAVTATAYMIGSAPAELFAAAVPARSVAASTNADSESVLLRRQITDNGSYRSIFWSLPEETEAQTGRLWFIGIRSPQAAAVPVSAFSSYRRLRFKTPPLIVTGPDGRAMLAAAPFMLAWGLHE